MPLYEYRCDTCGHEFEALQKMSDEALEYGRAMNEKALDMLPAKQVIAVPAVTGVNFPSTFPTGHLYLTASFCPSASCT